MTKQFATVDQLREVMIRKGLIRSDSLGEIWCREGLAVIVGANEIVVTRPMVSRHFNRSAGGLLLAIENLEAQP